MKLPIDVSSISMQSPDLLKKFVRKALLRRYDIATVEFLNKKFKEMNERGVYFIEDRKCNFDVEIGTDMRVDDLRDGVGTFVLWSVDSDFADPIKTLILNGKKVVLFATAGRIARELNALVKNGLYIFDIFELRDEDRALIFKQVLAVVRQLFTIKFKDFGWVNFDRKESYSTYDAFLKKEFDERIAKIKTEKLCAQKDIDQVEIYFNRRLFVFREDEPVFVHTDVHMGNILHEGKKLTALIDFDWSLKAPKVRALLSLLGLIDRPQQFVEGTKDFPKYKGKNFYHLLPVLKSEFPEVFSDPQLLRKLNLLFISEGGMWISENWSARWNREMIKDLVDNELPEGDLNQTYYGKVLSQA
jgi:hypothetical protein